MIDTKNEWVGLSPFDKLKRLAEQVRPGMYRFQVEQLFPRSNGGIQGQTITIYNEFPEMRIEVPFNNNGGSGHPENKVIGMAKIFMRVS